MKELLELIFIIYILVFNINTKCFSNSKDSSNILQIRMNKIQNLSANFTLKIISNEGLIIQEGNGELYIQRPNLFHFYIKKPEENYLISDGENIWFYEPNLQQVNVRNINNFIDNIPFILLIKNFKNEIDFKKYIVKKDNNKFSIHPYPNDSDIIKLFTVSINQNGIINSFSIIESTGQTSIYTLDNQKINYIIDKKKFNFDIPNGTILDDQR